MLLSMKGKGRGRDAYLLEEVSPWCCSRGLVGKQGGHTTAPTMDLPLSECGSKWVFLACWSSPGGRVHKWVEPVSMHHVNQYDGLEIFY